MTPAELRNQLRELQAADPKTHGLVLERLAALGGVLDRADASDGSALLGSISFVLGRWACPPEARAVLRRLRDDLVTEGA